jgi:DNA-binding transcriptional ArsR family regulator
LAPTKKANLSNTVELRMAKALSHPIRVRILTILHKQTASPNMVAQEIGEGLSQVSYHFKVLKDFRCIELVGTEPRRGAVEHFYRAISRPFLTDSDWKQLPETVRRGISAVGVQMIVHDAMEALGADTFDSREDRHLSRTPLTLDEQGWKDVASVLAETLDRVLEIQGESSSRLAEGDKEGIPSKVQILHFESPEPQPSNNGSKARA